MKFVVASFLKSVSDPWQGSPNSSKPYYLGVIAGISLVALFRMVGKDVAAKGPLIG